MVVEPVVSAAIGALSGAIDGVGVLAARGLGFALGMSALGESSASLISSVISGAMSRRLGTSDTWETIGIGMAVAATEAMLITLALAYTGIYSIEEVWSDSFGGAHSVRGNMRMPELPLHRAGSSGTLTLVRRAYAFEPIELPGTSRSNPGAQLSPDRRLTMPPIPTVRRRITAAEMPQSARPGRLNGGIQLQ
jgi:hypothetical protein